MDYMMAVKRPYRDLKKLGIGAAMYVVPMVNIITQFFGMGYVLECAKGSLKGDNKLPEWKDWGNLFVKGLLALIICVIWAIPLMIVSIVVGGALVAGFIASAQTWQMPTSASLGAMGGGGILIALVAILTGYVLPSAILSYVKEDKFGAGFKFGEIFKNAFTGNYFVAWIISIAAMIVISIIAGILSAILAVTFILPYVVMALASFTIGVTTATIMAEAYGKLGGKPAHEKQK